MPDHKFLDWSGARGVIENIPFDYKRINVGAGETILGRHNASKIMQHLSEAGYTLTGCAHKWAESKVDGGTKFDCQLCKASVVEYGIDR